MADSLAVPTGIVVIVFQDVSAITAGCVMERAPESGSGTPGPFAPIGTLTTVDPSGTPFIDLLPDDGLERYYRAKNIALGFDDSAYTEVVSAKPTVLPTNVDYNSKPWLFNGSLPLQLVMDVIADTTSSLSVSASINKDPANLGTPVVSVLSYFGVSTPTPIGGNTWLIAKPPSGSGRVNFVSTMAGRLQGTDGIDIQHVDLAANSSSFVTLTMNQTATTATNITVSSSVINPKGFPLGTSVYSTTGVTPIRVSNGIWTILRPSSSVDTIVFQVTSSDATMIPDEDTVDISWQNFSPLSVVATVYSSSTTTMNTRWDVRDPFQSTGALTGITFNLVSQSISGFTGSFGALSNTNGVYSQLVDIGRPNYGGGVGIMRGIVSKSGYTPDEDDVSCPEITTGLAHLQVKLKVTAENPNTVVVSASAVDPMALSGDPTPSLFMQLQPSGSFTGTNPWTVNRPESGSVTVFVSASKAGRVDDYQTQAVVANPSALSISSFMELALTQTSATATTVVVSASVLNSPDASPYIKLDSSNNDGGISGTNPFTITRPTSGVATYNFVTTSSVAGKFPDYHPFYVASTNTSVLNVLAVPLAPSNTTVPVNVTVYDPLNATTTLSGITLTESDGGNLPSAPVLNSTTNNTGNTVYNYTITRPNPGSGIGRVMFKATATGYTPGADTVDVAEAAVIPLSCFVAQSGSTDLKYILTVTGSDFVLGSGAPSMSIVNPAGITTNRDSTAVSASTVFEVWTLTRPTGIPATVQFQATKLNRYSSPLINFQVQAKVPTKAALDVKSTMSGTGDGNVTIFYSYTGSITLSIDNGPYMPLTAPSASSPWVIARTPIFNGDLFHYYDFMVVGDDGQTLKDDVTIPCIGNTAVTPNLSVVPGTQTSKTQPFTIQATDFTGITSLPVVTTMQTVNCTTNYSGSNLCLQSEAVSTSPWVNNSCTITTNTTVAPDGNTTADTVTDAGGAGVGNSIYQPITFTGNGSKVVAVYLKQGTSTKNDLAIFDITAGSFVHQIHVTWTGGVPALTSGTGTGTLYNPQFIGSGWYRIMFAVDNVIAANSNRVYCYPSPSGATGTSVIVWGMQVEDAGYPSTYARTTSSIVGPISGTFTLISAGDTVTVYRPNALNNPASVIFTATLNGATATVQRTILNADVDTDGKISFAIAPLASGSYVDSSISTATTNLSTATTGSIGAATSSLASRVSSSIANATASLSASFAASTTAVSASIVGKFSGSITPNPAVAAFYSSATDLSANTISLFWVVNNPPAGGTYDVQYTNDAGNSGTYSNVTSTYVSNADGQDIVSKGTGGASMLNFSYLLLVKNASSAVVASATCNWSGWYIP